MASQENYVKTLPLHSSQRVLVDDETEYRVAINVVPNYELIHQILKLGETVKIMESLWLVDEIKRILKNTLEKY